MELIVNEGSLKNIVDATKEVVDTYKDTKKKGSPEVYSATPSEIDQSPEAKELFDKFTGGTKKSVKAYSDFTNNKIVLTVDVSKLPSEVVSLIDPKGSEYSKYFTKYDKDSHSATYEFPVSKLTKDDVKVKDREITSRGGDVEKEESVMAPTPTPYKLRLAHEDGSFLTDEEIDQWLSEDLQMSAPKAYMDSEDYPYLKVNINGKDYSFEMKDESPYSIDQMQDKILKMQKYSLGKALQFMKKNMLGTRMESLEEDTPAIEAPDKSNATSIVDVIKNAYDEGKFGKLPCVGRQNACQIDISGVDKDRLISFFDKKKEFNREDHNEAGVNSVEFISDKFDVEVFDSFIQIYIIPQYESIKRMTIDEFSDTVNEEEESLKEEKSTSLKSTHLCSGCGKPIGECTCDVEEDESKVDEALNVEESLNEGYDIESLKKFILSHPDILDGLDKYDSREEESSPTEEDLSSGATQSSSIGQHKVDSIDLIEEVGQWKELDCKQVPDSDGFTTDYTLYTDGSKFVCIFGDKEVYLPDDEEFDYETENEEDAREWFRNYEGTGDEG